MTTDLAIRTGLPGELRSNAYILPPDLTFAEWSSVVRLAEHIAEASPWWLADAMAYGEDKFAEEHSQALPAAEEDPHGISQARLKQAAWMGHKYPPVTRVPGASYTHHRVAADLPPGDRAYLLGAAVTEKWSTRTMIERVHERQEYWRGRAVDAAGDSVETADLPWVPGKSELTEVTRAALNSRLAGIGRRHATGFEAGFIACLVWLEQKDCFEEWRL